MEQDGNKSVSVNVPIGVIATAVLLAVAVAAAYMLAGNSDSEASSGGRRSKAGSSMFRRFGLMTLVTLIENDATRRVVVATLKAIARRG